MLPRTDFVKTCHVERQRTTFAKETNRIGATMLVFEVRLFEDHAYYDMSIF